MQICTTAKKLFQMRCENGVIIKMQKCFFGPTSEGGGHEICYHEIDGGYMTVYCSIWLLVAGGRVL